MENALFSSKSLADFWGKKWNLVLHGVLKVSSSSKQTLQLYRSYIVAHFFDLPTWFIPINYREEFSNQCAPILQQQSL